MDNVSNSVYKLLMINRKTALASYKRLKKLKGLWCEIQRPVTNGTIFGLEDLVEYDEEVKEKDKLLLVNIFQEGEQGMEGYDTFIDAYAITSWEDKLPLQTLIRVDFCGRSMTFKVDTHRNITPALCEHLFVKNMLVAAT